MEITAAIVDEVDAPFKYVDLEMDEPGSGEALVRIVATGVCHTDENTRRGNMPLPLPGVLGHEGAGVVEAVGPEVTNVAVGDHVVIGWPYCGSCRNCLDGEHRYCSRVGEALTGGVRLLGDDAGKSGYKRPNGAAVSGHFFGQSSFATYSLTLAQALVPIDKSVPLDVVGPLACGIATGAGAVFNTVKPSLGDSLVVYGAGAVGLAAIMAAVNTAATTVIAVDMHESRLALATQLGATHVINAASANDVVAEVHSICDGPADFALDCTGVIAVLEQAIASVGMRGKAVLIGGAPAGATFEADHFSTLFGKRIVGVLGGGSRSLRLIPGLIELWQQGRFPFDKLITHFEFNEIEKALEASHSGDVIKPVVRIDAVK